MIKCKFCGKKYSKKGTGTHIWRNHGNGKQHNPNIGFKTGIRKIWNKGLTKDNNESLKKAGLKYKEGAKIALILGQKEALEDSIIIRDMVSGVQETVLIEKVINEVKKRLKQ